MSYPLPEGKYRTCRWDGRPYFRIQGGLDQREYSVCLSMALLAGKALKLWLCEVAEAEDQRREKLMQVLLFKDRLASAKIGLKVEPRGLRSGLCTKSFLWSYQLSAPDREVCNDEKRTNFCRTPTPRVEGTAEIIQCSFPSLMRKDLTNTAVNLVSAEHPELGALLLGPLKSETLGPSHMMHWPLANISW